MGSRVWRIAAALVLAGSVMAARADEDRPEPWARLLADPSTRSRALDALSYGADDTTRVSTRARALLADLARARDWDWRRRAAIALGKARAVEHLELLRGDTGRLALRALEQAPTWPAAEVVLRGVAQGNWLPVELGMLAGVADARAESALREALASSSSDAGAARDQRFRGVFADGEAGREVALAPGLFGLVHRHGSHTWTIVVVPVASARGLAAIDGSLTSSALGERFGASATARTVLALAVHDLIDWTAKPPGAPFDTGAVPGAGHDPPAIAAVLPCFWGE